MTTIAAIEPIVVNVSPKTNWTFVAVTDRDGATGWGECSLNGWETLLVAETARLSRIGAIGCDARRRGAAGALPAALAGRHWSRMPCAARSSRRARIFARARPASRFARCSQYRRRAIDSRLRQHQSRRHRAHARRRLQRRRGARSRPAIVRSKIAPFDGVIAEDAATTPIDARIRAGLDRVFAVREAIGDDAALHGRLPLALRRAARGDAHSRPRARGAVLGRVPDLRASVVLSRDRAAYAASRTNTA